MLRWVSAYFFVPAEVIYILARTPIKWILGMCSEIRCMSEKRSDCLCLEIKRPVPCIAAKIKWLTRHMQPKWLNGLNNWSTKFSFYSYVQWLYSCSNSFPHSIGKVTNCAYFYYNLRGNNNPCTAHSVPVMSMENNFGYTKGRAKKNSSKEITVATIQMNEHVWNCLCIHVWYFEM